MSSKLENFLLFLLLWMLYFISMLLIPIQNSRFDPLLRFFICGSITIVVYFIYSKKRNNYFLKKSRHFLDANNIDTCLSYLNTLIKRYNKLTWLKYEKLMILGMGGRINEFHSYSAELNRQDQSFMHHCGYSVSLFNSLFAYLNNDSIEITIDKETTDLEKIIWLLSHKAVLNSSFVIEYALMLFEKPCWLFKSVSSFILAKEYKVSGDYKNSILFFDMAKRYAPSPEILFCIKKSQFDFE